MIDLLWMCTSMCTLSSCLGTEKASTEFLTILNSKDHKSKVHLYGAYQPQTKIMNGITGAQERSFLQSPVYFFDDGLVFYERIRIKDSTEWVTDLKKYGNSQGFVRNWGVYQMKGDTINAIIYQYFETKSFFRHVQRLLTHYQGIVQADTIKGWHMIPPYPKRASEFELNHGLLLTLKIPRDNYFKPLAVQQLIDPKKAWINQLRDKKLNNE